MGIAEVQRAGVHNNWLKVYKINQPKYQKSFFLYKVDCINEGVSYEKTHNNLSNFKVKD